MSYFVYMLKCADGSLYTGWTNDLEKRLHSHNHSTVGAKYTRSRRPVRLVWSERHALRIDALKREREIKKLTRKEKLFLIQ